VFQLKIDRTLQTFSGEVETHCIIFYYHYLFLFYFILVFFIKLINLIFFLLKILFFNQILKKILMESDFFVHGMQVEICKLTIDTSTDLEL
jgi:hypothetical protein